MTPKPRPSRISPSISWTQKTGIAKDNPLVADKKLPAVDKDKKTVTIYSGRQKLYAVIALPEEYLDRPAATWDAGDEVRIYYQGAGQGFTAHERQQNGYF